MKVIRELSSRQKQCALWPEACATTVLHYLSRLTSFDFEDLTTEKFYTEDAERQLLKGCRNLGISITSYNFF